MEQHEEKGRKSPLPIDLTSEILLRLPEKSVARFRCVSKLWLSISTDQYFINLFETRHPRPSLLLCFIKDENWCVSSIPQHTHTLRQDSNKEAYSSSQPIESYHMKFPGVEYIRRPPTESVHGLICFQGREKLIVWNPSKRQFSTLPKPNDFKVFLGLGYDPIEGKHKVICMPLNSSSDLCQVLTLGSAQESWRTVKTNHKHRGDSCTSGRCIDGVIYYVAYIHQTDERVVMSFDVRSEKFNMIRLPSSITQRGRLVTYQGKLACLKECETRLWILEDAKKGEWSGSVYPFPPYGYYNECLPTPFIQKDGKKLEQSSRVYTFPPSDCNNERLPTPFMLRGITHTGEFIYVPAVFKISSYLLFCDPFTKVYRRFKFKGIAEGQGFAARRQPGLYAFPNHIESQISL